MTTRVVPDEEGESVRVYLYDLSMGMARQFSGQFLGKQIDGIWCSSSPPPNRSHPFASSVLIRRIRLLGRAGTLPWWCSGASGSLGVAESTTSNPAKRPTAPLSRPSSTLPQPLPGVRVARGMGVVAPLALILAASPFQRNRTQYGHNVNPAGAVHRDAG